MVKYVQRHFVAVTHSHKSHNSLLVVLMKAAKMLVLIGTAMLKLKLRRIEQKSSKDPYFISLELMRCHLHYKIPMETLIASFFQIKA